LGATGPAFNSAFGFYLIYFAVYVYFLSIGALKTNVTLFVIVFTVALVFNLL
jgi:succinate-acetate transporter protein